MRGITVTLYNRTQSGTDDFGAPVWTETGVSVDNVLIGQPTTDEITAAVDLQGARIDYMLGIPKGDAHEWQDRKVSWSDAYGRTITVKTFGIPITGIAALVPGAWHMKVRCCRIE